MKKIIYSLAIASIALGFSGCKETWDDNPVYKGHEGTVQADFLNIPAMQNLPLMITEDNKQGNFVLTCSQPDFGYAAVATYRVQVSYNQAFPEGEYIEINQDFFDCAAIAPVNGDVAAAIEKLAGVQDEHDLPLPYNTVYMRLRAFLAQSPDDSQFISNVVHFDKVSADYLAIWVADVPVEMYLRGGMNGWGAPAEWQFKTGAEENTWVVKNVTIDGGTEFKVADAGWGACNWGAGDNPTVTPGEEYELNTGNNPGNLKIESDFSGNIQLRLEKGNYYLLLDPIN